MERIPAVYILASHKNGTLYTGVTSNLLQRIWQHRTDAAPGFSQTYGVHTLVYFEVHEDMLNAITREKQLKGWRRQWKINLIETTNPTWSDLWPALLP